MSKFAQRVSLRIVLPLKRHQDCNFQLNTKGKIGDHHLKQLRNTIKQ